MNMHIFRYKNRQIYSRMKSDLMVYFNVLFYTGVWLINNVVLVSGVQQSNSVTCKHVSIIFLILFPFRLVQIIKQNPLP